MSHMIAHGPAANFDQAWQRERANFFSSRSIEDLHLGCFQSCADQNYGYHIINYGGEYAGNRDIHHSLHYLKENRMDALIYNRIPQDLAEQLIQLPTQKPIVSYFWGRAPENYPLPYVALDSSAAIDELVQHLKNAGHRHVLCVDGDKGHQLDARSQSCIDKLEALAIHVHLARLPNIDVGDKSIVKNHTSLFAYMLDHFAEAFAPWFAANEDARTCTAVVGTSDSLALAAMRVLQQQGFQVPGDMAIIGFDNIHAEAQIIPLSSVDQNFYQVGRKLGQFAVELSTLGSKWQSHIEDFQVHIPATFYPRQSS
ncbi:MAG: LacI family DNA-binding transcriptional regulator [Planctomycetes bacterium]|nr:LacI family DNA-binding transcriptional regulator [Planctomycetota bacterium]